MSLRMSFALLVIITAAIGCNVSDDALNGTSQMTVHLTDAPGDYDAVYVDIKHIKLKLDNPGDYTSTKNMNSEGWITLNDQSMRVNLLDLRNGNTIQLGSEELDAGNYKQMRVILGSNNEVVVDGQSHPLAKPTALESGVNLTINANIDEGEIFNLLIDFDAGRSIIQTGPDEYILNPVLRAVDLESCGSISGKIQPADTQMSIMAINNADTLSTINDVDGKFSLIGVSPGTYNMVIKPVNNSLSGITIPGVEVKKGQQVALEPVDITSE